VAVVAVGLLVASCEARPAALGESIRGAVHEALLRDLKMESTRRQPSDLVLTLVQRIPPNASAQLIRGRLDSIVASIGRATPGDISFVREALFVLRGQPAAVSAIAGAYRTTPAEKIQQRILLLTML